MVADIPMPGLPQVKLSYRLRLILIIFAQSIFFVVSSFFLYWLLPDGQELQTVYLCTQSVITIFTVFGIAYASYGAHKAIGANRVAETMKFMDAYMNPTFRAAERFIKSRFSYAEEIKRLPIETDIYDTDAAETILQRKIVLEGDSIDPLRIETKLIYAINTVCAFYDRVGILAAAGVIDTDVLFLFIGKDIIACWDNISPLVYALDLDRRKSDRGFEERGFAAFDSPYSSGFYFLAKSAREWQAPRYQEQLIYRRRERIYVRMEKRSRKPPRVRTRPRLVAAAEVPPAEPVVTALREPARAS